MQSYNTKFKIIFFLIIFFSFFGLAESSRAAMYFMAPNGKDSADGLSETTGWKTFDHAVSRLDQGDTLILLDGGYTTAGAGNFYADCGLGGNAKNGKDGSPITIKAKNQRRAKIDNDGMNFAFQLLECNWWIIDGLTITSKDNEAGKGGGNVSGTLIILGGSSHNIIRNNLWARINRWAGGGGLVISGGGTGNLIEDNELYDFDRNGIYPISSDGNVFRRNYCNSSTNRGGDPNYTGPNDCYPNYYAKENIFENNIAEDNAVCFGSSGQRSKFLGNITLKCSVSIAFGTHPQQGMTAEGNYAKDHLSVEALSGGNGLNSRSALNSIVENSSFFGSASANGIVGDNSRDTRRGAGACGCYPCNAAGLICNSENPCKLSCEQMQLPGLTVRNILIKDVPAGVVVNDSSEYVTRVFEYTVGWNNKYGTWRSGTETRDSATTPPPGVSATSDIGNCLAWIPASSSLKGKGKNGVDIGANILYRYENGILSDVPLWNPQTGEFPHGAIIAGINDRAGESLFDVHERLNINRNGCNFPAGYGSSNDTQAPAAPQGLLVQ